MSQYRPQGIFTALVTPFTTSGELDLPTIKGLVDYQLSAGIHGLMTTGGSGEYVTLTDTERRRVLDAVLEAVGGQVPVMAGVLAPDTASAVATTRAAKQAGAMAALVLTPYYVHPSLDGLYAHFARVAEVGLPILAYNNPGRTGINIGVDLLVRLITLEPVVGMKECDRDMGRVAEKLAATAGRLSILAGDDDLLYPDVLLGSPGAIMAISNLAPAICVAIYDALARGEVTRAREHFFDLLPLIFATRGPNHPGPLKQAHALVGRPVGTGRLPLAPLTTEELQARFEKPLRHLGLLRTDTVAVR